MAPTFVANDRSYCAPTRPVLAICADGWDPDYVDDALERSLMPRIADALAAGGTYALGRAQVPTFTNPNNVTIVTRSPRVTGLPATTIATSMERRFRSPTRASSGDHDPRRRARRGHRRLVRHRQGQAAGAARLRRRPDVQRRVRTRAGARGWYAGHGGRGSAESRYLRLAAVPLHDRSGGGVDGAARGQARICVADRFRPARRRAGRGDGRRVLSRNR